MRSSIVIPTALAAAAACAATARSRRRAPAPRPAPRTPAPVGPAAPAPALAAPDVTVPDARVRERGRFCLGGWAPAGGHATLAGVTFRSRLGADPDPGALRISVERVENVPSGGVRVLDDPGFAPDREGFALMAAAAGAGAFAVAGRYELTWP